MLPGRRTLRTFCLVTEARHRRSHSAGLHLYEMSRIGKSRDRDQSGGCWGLGGGAAGLLNGNGVSFCGDEKVLELNGADGGITL